MGLPLMNGSLGPCPGLGCSSGLLELCDFEVHAVAAGEMTAPVEAVFVGYGDEFADAA